MPKQWTALHDQKMLAYILKNCNVKVSNEDLAKVVGEGTTAKAISHRLANIKKTLLDDGEPVSSPTDKSEGNRKRHVEDGGSAKKASKRMKIEAANSDEGSENAVVPAPAGKRSLKGGKSVANGFHDQINGTSCSDELVVADGGETTTVKQEYGADEV